MTKQPLPGKIRGGRRSPGCMTKKPLPGKIMGGSAGKGPSPHRLKEIQAEGQAAWRGAVAHCNDPKLALNCDSEKLQAVKNKWFRSKQGKIMGVPVGIKNSADRDTMKKELNEAGAKV